MPYCPSCRTEYQAGVERCSDCDTPLVEGVPDLNEEAMTEVFRANNREGALRICTVILDGLHCIIRERGSRAFPTPSVSGGNLFIAVPADQADRALQLLVEAGEDGALSPEDGEFVEEEAGEE